MAGWEQFEKDSTNFLNDRFSQYARFIHQGGADSTAPDILVETKMGNSFYIEAKCTPAQCGQFVLIPNIETSAFEYSKLNATRPNKYALLIMDYMNDSFDEFREAGTAGKDINMPNKEDVFSGWVINTYSSKGTCYFITNGYVIVPIERFQMYFDITAKYRIKRSGSSSVGKSRIDAVSNYIRANGFPIDSIKSNGDKLMVTSRESIHNQRFVLGAYEYMFSLRDEQYEVRKLSNTYNANVIFSITRKGNLAGLSDSEFISFLKK